MGTSLDGAGAPSSLTQRRQAASNLPVFELPPPSQFATGHYKFPPLSGMNAPNVPTAVSVGNLLTPPPNSGSDSGQNSVGLHQHPHQGMPILPYTPTFWPGAGVTAAGYGGLNHQSYGQPFGGKPMFSPMPSSHARTVPTSPANVQGSSLPPPHYDMHSVQSYSHSVPLTSPGSSLSHNAQHQSLGSSMMTNSTRPTSQASPLSPADAVSKATSAPGMFAAMSASSTPQPPYGFQSGTSVSQSPHSVSAPASTTSPPLHHGPIPQLQTSPFVKPPYPSYSLPGMPGPVLTNINHHSQPMTLVGNMQAQMLPMHFNSGFAANPQLAYAQARANSPQQAANQDRPFKCDECPQSFNRNHDLKRHKRIHLAVKPFPCNHCDKSFSRKDALKRHILVKGCGKAGDSESNAADGVKSESGSESQDASSLSIAQ